MEAKDRNKMYGTGAVAKLLGIPRHRLMWLLDMGKLPQPEIQVPGRRLFTWRDVEILKDAYDNLLACSARKCCKETVKEEDNDDSATI